MNKMWYTHTVEYYSALQRKDILIHATTWMNPEDSENSQLQKGKYCMILLIRGTWSSQIHRGRKWLPEAGGRDS